ncbi:MAG: hypothetical protein JNK87_42480 [Bryobacterales bacterium]|nr:hypothetical protein [Bryobacterales bacterium]
MPTESELLHTWRSAPNRPNILVLAPSEAIYLPHVMEMRESDSCEVVHVKTGEAAIRLLRRGAIAVLLLDGQATEPGGVELIAEALNKDDPPRIVVLSTQASARGAYESRQVRRARIPMDKDTLQKLIRTCAKEFSGQPSPVAVGEVVDSIHELADPGWLRITDRHGKSGDLCFQETRAVYAETGDLAGEAAARAIAQWGDCRFEWRELPPYLQGNMDLPLTELLAGARKDQAGTVPNAAAPAPSFHMPAVGGAAADAMEVEEPAEFAFENELLGGGDPDGMLLDLPGEMDWARSPDEPETSAAGEWGVEEPSDLSLDFTAFEALDAASEPEPVRAEPLDAEPPRVEPPRVQAVASEPFHREPLFSDGAWSAPPARQPEPQPAPWPEPERVADVPSEPAWPTVPPTFASEFAMPPLYPDPPDMPEPPVMAPPPRIERAEKPRLSSTLFQATAILTESGAMETCAPASEAGSFDLVWLRGIYRQVSEHLCAKGMGEVTELPILGAVGGLVISPLPDGRLLAVRLRTGAYGWEERDELDRLRQAALAVSAPAFR